MSNQFQQNYMNIGSNQNYPPTNINAQFNYSQQKDNSNANINKSMNINCAKNEANNNDININNFVQNDSLNKTSKNSSDTVLEKKKGYNTDYKSKGVYKKNIVKQFNMNNKSNKSNKINNKSDNSNEIKVNTVFWYKKNINRNNVLKSKQKEIAQSNQSNSKNNSNQKGDEINTKLVFSNSNIQLNMPNNYINNKNNINNQYIIQNNKVNNSLNNHSNNIQNNNTPSKKDNIQSNISQKKISQSYVQNSINNNFSPFAHNSQNQFNFPSNIPSNIQFNIPSSNNNSNINQNVININQNNININHNNFNINNNDYQNQNQNQNMMNQSQNNHDINTKTFDLIQKSNQFNNQSNNNILMQNSSKNKLNMKSSKYSFARYKKAAMTGLKNLGNTSYLNSVLQLLCSIRTFSSYFLNPKNGAYFENDIQKYSLSFVFYRLCTHLYPFPEKRGRELYKPDSFMLLLGASNAVYKDYKAKDPNMLISYILYKLHDELNNDKNKGNNFSDINMNIASNREATINNGLKNFYNNNSSRIFNYFGWFEIKETKCMNCNNELYSLLNFFTFELNIYDCARFGRYQQLRIENCLKFYKIPKIKKKYCYFCKGYNEVTTTTQIYSSPNIFIFLLNLENYTDDKDYDNINFIIEKNINLGNFIENKIGPLKYELNGIVFLDEKRKKYITICQSPVDLQWYFYDDEIVEMIEYETFFEKIEQNNLIYKPYILLYKNMGK